jgi:hypothetical protein
MRYPASPCYCITVQSDDRSIDFAIFAGPRDEANRYAHDELTNPAHAGCTVTIWRLKDHNLMWSRIGPDSLSYMMAVD